MGDGSRERWKRREYLTATAVVGVGGLAGCSGTDDTVDGTPPEASPGQTPDETPTPEDTPTPEETPTPAPPAPVIEAATFEPTAAAGELTYDLHITAETTIEAVRIETEATAIEDFPERSSLDSSGTIAGTPGELNDISVFARTDEGGETSETTSQYCRKYDEHEGDIETQISPHYLLFWDAGRTKTFEECGVGTPAVGPYSQHAFDFTREPLERHFDQMLGHGITRVTLNFGESDSEHLTVERYLEDVRLFDEMDIEFSHPIIQAVRRERDIFEDYELMAEVFASRENLGTVDDRPVVYFWGFAGLFHEDESYERIEQSYGSLTELVPEIRDALTVEGTEPFLVPDIAALGRQWVEHDHEPPDLYDAVQSCDGVSHWFPPILGQEGQPAPEPFVADTESIMETTRTFAREHGLEYIPVIFPGFDDRGNDCWGEDRLAEPSTEMLAETADLATEYGTVDLTFVATYNDWAEGHMVEPGSYAGSEYGTDRLEILRERLVN